MGKGSQPPAPPAVLRFVKADARGWDDHPLLCDECSGPLDAYRLERPGERTKAVICCRTRTCSNSAQATAGIFKAQIVGVPAAAPGG